MNHKFLVTESHQKITCGDRESPETRFLVTESHQYISFITISFYLLLEGPLRGHQILNQRPFVTGEVFRKISAEKFFYPETGYSERKVLLG